MKQKFRTKKLKRQLKKGGADPVAAVKSGIAGDLYKKFGEVISAVATVKKMSFKTKARLYGKDVDHTFFDTLEINIKENTEIDANKIKEFTYASFIGLNDTATVLEDKKEEGKLVLKLHSDTIDKERKLLESKAETQIEPNTTEQVAVYFSKKPIQNIGEFIKYAKANKGPAKSLLELAREKDKGAAAAAVVVSGIGLAGQVSVTILASTGVGLPLAGAIAGLLLITNKLANMYIHKLKMKAVLYDVITIISSCFIIYDLIDRVLMITTIVLNADIVIPLTLDEGKSLTPLPTPESSDVNHPPTDDKGDESIPVSIQKAFKEMTDYVSVAMNLKNKSQARLNQIEKLKTLQKDPKSGDSTYKELLAAAHIKKEQRLLPLIKANKVDQIPLEDRVSLNIDIQKRLYEKMQGLTEMLLQNAREKDLRLLESDPQMQRSGFGAIVKKELESREGGVSDEMQGYAKRGLTAAYNSAKNAYNTANRVYSRNFDSDTIRKDVMAELSLVLGYFFLLKNQYDLILDTYKDTIPEWPEIYAIIRETEEFKLLVVPPDPVEYSKKVIEENEAQMATAAKAENAAMEAKAENAAMEAISEERGGALKTKKHNKNTKWNTRKNK